MHRFAALWFVTFAAWTAPALGAQNVSGKEPFARSRLVRDGGRFGMLLRQFRADEPSLPDRFESGRREAMAQYQSARDLPAAHWVWVRPFWFLFRDGPVDVPVARQWGPEQACGEPDTKEAGDLGTAWATREQDAAGEWLMLEYGPPVRAASVEIHETFNPGAVESIVIFDPAGNEIEVWRARAIAPASEAKRALKIDLPLGFTIERLLLRLRSEAVPGWNEIDAVGLRDDKGKMHWAARAEASSTFASTLPAPVILPVAAVAPVGAPVAAFAVWRRYQEPEAAKVGQVEVFQYDVPLAIQSTVPAATATAPGANADAENKALHARLAELEAKVKALQAELDKARAAGKR